jgi:hypothetical protein
VIPRTVYCVEPYRRERGVLRADFPLEFSCETVARRVGASLRLNVPAMAIYKQEVEPEYGARGEPTVIALFGAVPR